MKAQQNQAKIIFMVIDFHFQHVIFCPQLTADCCMRYIKQDLGWILATTGRVGLVKGNMFKPGVVGGVLHDWHGCQ